ncbi:unnamed protein product [Toxocara canis]|uniref:Uncharacterized protein n=1 Tax=Toxocara canis TaxID=6265 RepID=A0A183U0D8_TOXCA|nr:unnamed protein product [Toxocara canis]
MDVDLHLSCSDPQVHARHIWGSSSPLELLREIEPNSAKFDRIPVVKDDEFELEDFLCIDEEQDTSEQPSTSEANFSNRTKPFERNRGAGPCDRPREAFRADSSNWPGKSPLWRGRCSPSGLSRTVWKQRVRDPLPMGRHPDYDASLERRNRERGEVDFKGETNKEEKRSPENGCSREDCMERKRERRIAQVRNVTEEVTLEEVDCCKLFSILTTLERYVSRKVPGPNATPVGDSEEEGVRAVMCESDEGQMTFEDASRRDDDGLVVRYTRFATVYRITKLWYRV